ncbi:hypothetical protein J6590_104342 [Homalodisca vitripennis]|nr:hypothetical protein J6590_104342 [Homalodisca vitripennis]
MPNVRINTVSITILPSSKINFKQRSVIRISLATAAGTISGAIAQDYYTGQIRRIICQWTGVRRALDPRLPMPGRSRGQWAAAHDAAGVRLGLESRATPQRRTPYVNYVPCCLLHFNYNSLISVKKRRPSACPLAPAACTVQRVVSRRTINTRTATAPYRKQTTPALPPPHPPVTTSLCCTDRPPYWSSAQTRVCRNRDTNPGSNTQHAHHYLEICGTPVAGTPQWLDIPFQLQALEEAETSCVGPR